MGWTFLRLLFCPRTSIQSSCPTELLLGCGTKHSAVENKWDILIQFSSHIWTEWSLFLRVLLVYFWLLLKKLPAGWTKFLRWSSLGGHQSSSLKLGMFTTSVVIFDSVLMWLSSNVVWLLYTSTDEPVSMFNSSTDGGLCAREIIHTFSDFAKKTKQKNTPVLEFSYY